MMTLKVSTIIIFEVMVTSDMMMMSDNDDRIKCWVKMRVGDHGLTHNLCENICGSARHRKLRGSHQNGTIIQDQSNHNGYIMQEMMEAIITRYDSDEKIMREIIIMMLQETIIKVLHEMMR